MPVIKGTEYSHRNLPHLMPERAIFFVTFNLKGAVPRSALIDLCEGRKRFVDYDALLHAAPIHWLRDPSLAQIVYDRMESLPGLVHDMHAFTVMSNHVHAMFSVHDDSSLSEVMQRIKGATSRKCNLLLERSGEFWQEERYDRVVRRNEFWRILWYILNNPVKAGIVERWQDYPFTFLNDELYPGLRLQ
jgi:putative transposase